jgi:hypothetical protein
MRLSYQQLMSLMELKAAYLGSLLVQMTHHLE